MAAISFKLFKSLKIILKIKTIIKYALQGERSKALSYLFKHASREYFKMFGKTLISSTPILGTIVGSMLGGIVMKLFI